MALTNDLAHSSPGLKAAGFSGQGNKKAFHNKYKNFYKNAETELWWTLDRAEHGGYHCKVYKETATGLEWVYNAETSEARIYGQHKSPGSRFIPYSELIFY